MRVSALYVNPNRKLGKLLVSDHFSGKGVPVVHQFFRGAPQCDPGQDRQTLRNDIRKTTFEVPDDFSGKK